MSKKDYNREVPECEVPKTEDSLFGEDDKVSKKGWIFAVSVILFIALMYWLVSKL